MLPSPCPQTAARTARYRCPKRGISGRAREVTVDSKNTSHGSTKSPISLVPGGILSNESRRPFNPEPILRVREIKPAGTNNRAKPQTSLGVGASSLPTAEGDHLNVDSESSQVLDQVTHERARRRLSSRGVEVREAEHLHRPPGLSSGRPARRPRVLDLDPTRSSGATSGPKRRGARKAG
jgi:hypothetical protein